MTERNINLAELKTHPTADLFPMLQGEAFAALVEDIRKAGHVRERVMLIKSEAGEWLVLDGRNRIAAAQAAGVAPPEYEIFEGDDAAALAFVLSKNLARRHLTDSQRALSMARLTLNPESEACNAGYNPITQGAAATMAGVSRKLVNEAAKVLRYGTPEQIAAIEAGEANVTNVAAEIKSAAERAAILKASEEFAAFIVRACEYTGVSIERVIYWIENMDKSAVIERLLQQPDELDAAE